MNKKNIAKLVSLAFTICILVLVSLSTSKERTERNYAFLSGYSQGVVDSNTSITSNQASIFSFNEKTQIFTPKLGKTFTGFKEELGFKESQNNYFIVNTLGYLGKYQFGRSTLSVIGITDVKKFLNTPELQEKAFIANTARNKWVLRRDIKRFSGKYINGIKVTESGILAAAHLAGPRGVKKYLRSYGAVGFKDAYGTSIRSYMKRFSGYDTSQIKPNRKPKVSLDA